MNFTRTGLLCGAALVLATGLGGRARANIVGFNGPWAPVNASGTPINGYGFSISGTGQSANASLSADHSQLTLRFTNPNGVSNSIFTQYAGVTLPSGTVSYHWSLTLDQTAIWLFETDAQGVLPLSDQHQTFVAGTYSGDVSLNYVSGNYFSFGNIGFGTGIAQSATAVLSNFLYAGPATVPEPASLVLVAVGCGLLGLTRRRRV